MDKERTSNSLLVVPRRTAFPDLSGQRWAIHDKFISARREQLLGHLRGLPLALEMAQTLRPEQTYRLVLPSGSILQQGTDGLYSGVIYDDKGIAAHARFLKTRQGLLGVAKGVGTQFLLISMAAQLTRIERLVESVIGEIHRDRIAEIQAGLIGLTEAMAIEHLSTRRHALTNAVQTLNGGLQKCYLEMMSGVTSLPSPENRFWDNWGLTSKSARASKKLRPLQETLDSYLAGLAGVAECYSLMDEPHASMASLRVRLQQLTDLDLPRLAAVARLVPVTGHETMPEEPWRRLFAHMPILEKQVALAESTNTDHGEICIDMTGEELTEVSRGKV